VPFSRNLGTLTSWNPLGLSRPVTGLLFTKKKETNTRDELVARIMNSTVLIRQERQDDLRRATRTLLLPRGLESALKAMVGFVNTFFELMLTCISVYLSQ